MSDARPRRARVSLGATLLLAALLVLNLPFYAGAGGERIAWRMEHGRLTLRCSESARPQGFWVAPNSEGLRWSPSGRFHAWNYWTVTLPLWIPLAICLGWHLAARRRR